MERYTWASLPENGARPRVLRSDSVNRALEMLRRPRGAGGYRGRDGLAGNPMKNFPHQYNDLVKLRDTLAVVDELNSSGESALDDGVFGHALARHRIYDFRPRIGSGSEAAVRKRIEQRLADERTKPASNQGTRTAAREMRRTLRYLGWIADVSTSITPAGEALLQTDPGSTEEAELLNAALIHIAVQDAAGRVSHPMQLLLRLVEDVGLIGRAGMEVVLEATDDSAAEYGRIAALASLPDDARRVALLALGWSDFQIQNARKILPAFAEQAGLIATDASGRFILTDAGFRQLGRAPTAVVTPSTRARPARTARGRHRSTAVTTSDSSKVGRSTRLSAADRRALTPEEQAIAAGLLYERTARHQQLVREFATRIADADFTEDPAAFDLLVDLRRTGALVLCEMKSIHADESAQVRAAVGQLLYYEYFSLPHVHKDRPVSKLVVVDRPVSEDLAEFLQTLGFGLVEVVAGRVTLRNAAASAILASSIS